MQSILVQISNSFEGGAPLPVSGKRISAALFMAALTALLASPAPAEELSLQSAPPVVVKTVPVAGAADVDPGLTELRVTFSKPMADGSWSWSTWGEENFPELNGKPRYLADGRTCVLPVKLQPGKFYATWLNSDKFHNFKDRTGHAAVPYLFTFETAKSGGGLGGGGAVAVAAAEEVAAAGEEDSEAQELGVRPPGRRRRLSENDTGWRGAVGEAEVALKPQPPF